MEIAIVYQLGLYVISREIGSMQEKKDLCSSCIELSSPTNIQVSVG